MGRIFFFLAMFSSLIWADNCCYPPHCYEEIAASYDQLAADYEQLAYDSHNCCGAFTVGFDYLYWRAFSDGLDYAIDGIGTSAQGTLYSIETGWSSGYRVYAGYEFPCQHWLLSASWTDYKTHPHSETVPATGLILYATKSNPTSTTLFTTLTRGQAAWDLHYSSFSVEMSYVYRMRYGLNFISQLGVRWDRIKDNVAIIYLQAAAPTTAFINQNQTLSGVGPKIGFGTDWNFFGPLSFYGNFSWSPLWMNGKFENRFDVVQASTANDVNVQDEGIEIIHSVDLGVGIKMDYHITPRFGLVFAVGWEAICWIDERHNIFFVDADRDGTIARDESDLLLVGLVARVMLTF